MLDLGALMVHVGTEGIDEAEKKISSLSGAGNGLKTAFKSIGAAAAAVTGAVAVGTTALIGGCKEVAAYGDNVDKLSQKLGLSKRGFQEWTFILEQNGTSIDSMRAGMKTLTNAMSDTESENGKLLQSLIGSTKDLSQEEAFEKTVTALQRVTDQTQRAAMAQQLFGRSGQELMPLLNSEQGSVEELKRQAEQYGMVMSDETVVASAKWTDSMNVLNHTITGLKNKMLGEFLPCLTSITDGLSNIFTGNVDEGVQQLSNGINSILNNVSAMLPQIAETAVPIISSLVNGIIANLPVMIDTAVQVIMQLVEGLISALPFIAETGTQIITSLITGLTNTLPELVPVAIEAIMQMVDTLLDNIDMLIDVATEMIIALADGLTGALPTLIAKAPVIIGRLLTAIANNLPKLLEMGVKLIIQLGVGLIQAIPQLIAAIPQIINAIFQAFLGYIGKMGEIGLNLVKGIWQGISNGYSWILGKIKGWVTNVLEFIKHAFGINSPSKKTEEFGKYLSQGLAVGIEKDDSPEVALEKKCKNLLSILREFTDDFDLMSDTAESTYDLWELQNMNADDMQKLIKQYEMLIVQAQAQADIVEVTNQAYWKQASLTGQNSVEARELANTLLQEQIALEKLNKSIGENIIARQKLNDDSSFEEQIKNIDYNYELWQAMNSQATEAEKQAKQNEVLTEKIKLSGDNLQVLNDELLKSNELYGENSKQSKEVIQNIKDETLAYYKLKAQMDEAAASAEALRKSQLLDSLNAQVTYNNLLKQKDSTHTTALGRQQAAWNESGMYKTGALVINQMFNTNTVTANQLYNSTKKAINDMEGAGAL